MAFSFTLLAPTMIGECILAAFAFAKSAAKSLGGAHLG